MRMKMNDNAINFETMTFDELRYFRKRIDISNVSQFNDATVISYLVKMVDVLLEIIEDLEEELEDESFY